MQDQKTFFLTKKGLERVKKDYEDLKRLRLAKTRGEVPKIWQSEDVNPEYLSFQEDLSFLESRIGELEYILKNVSLIKAPAKDKQNIVDLGATVTLQEEGGKINEFVVLGTLEANPYEGKISSESPVGRALLGKQVGEEVVITSPIKVVYRVKKVRYQIS